MPLMSMSPNVQELDSPSRKRTHTEYSDTVDELPACDSTKDTRVHYNKGNNPAAVPETTVTDSIKDLSLASSAPNSSRPASPETNPIQSSPPSLVEADSSNPAKDSVSPDTPTRRPAAMPPAKSTQPAGQAPPAKKRKRLTEEEKKVQAEEKAARDAEREQKRKEKEAEAEKKKAEAEKKKVEAEKKKAEAERKKAEAAEKKAEIEKKKREKEEEAERKQRAQPKIGSFFTKQPSISAPKEPRGLPVGARSPSPAAQERNEYQRIAQEFFVKENVTLASNKFALSPNSQAAKVAVLDDFVAGKREPVEIKSFDPFQSLRLPNGVAQPRGKMYSSVRGLLSSPDGLQTNPVDLTTESQNVRIQRTQEALKRIPIKHLKFHEDVRPAYYGTVTSVESLASLRKLARNPIAKDLPLNYDYDSEAEWVDGDDGEGDDVSLLDEEDVDEEDAEGMDDFLDDSEDVGRGPRMVAGTMEPESSGVCFEDRTRKNPNPQMYKFRMEFMIREQMPTLSP